MTRYGRKAFVFDCLVLCLVPQHNRMNAFVCQMAVKVFKSLWSSCITSSKNMLGMALNIAVSIIWFEHAAQC